MKLKDLSKDQLIKLAKEHISLYTGRLNSKSPTVRMDECKKLLKDWEWLMLKVRGGMPLNQNERTEIAQALDSGEYDSLLTP